MFRTLCKKWRIAAAAGAVAALVSGAPVAMASTHAPVKDWNASANGSSHVTVAGQAVAVGDVLVAFVAGDGPSNGGQTATVSGCGLTWSSLSRENVQPGDAETWTATATAVSSTCAVTGTLGKSGYPLAVSVADYGSAGSPTAAVAHAGSGAAKVSVANVPAGSALWLVGNDWDNAVSRSVMPGDSMVNQVLSSTGDTYWSETSASPVSGSATIGTSAPTADQWNAVAVVIPPASQQQPPPPPQSPAAPTGLTVTGTTSSTASLSWLIPSGTVSGYNVYRNGVKVGSTSSTTYTDSALAASTAYTYTVSAFNSAGESSQSNPAQATTQAGGGSGGCDLNATTATFASQVSAATAGQTICLASGNYGTFSGAAKTGMVTIKPQSGASVTMSLNWNSASFLTVTGMTIPDATIQGSSHDLVISYSTVTDIIHLLTDQFNHSNILIDHDTFPNTVASGGQGRVWTDFNSVDTSNIIGVTVSNSLFTGGDMIDILIEGGAGLQILNNEFTGMDNRINEAIHSDTIFNYGDTGFNVMKGNWFHDQKDVPTCGWAQWDGGNGNIFEDNVISHVGGPTGSDGCYQSLAILDDRNSVVTHNVIEPGTGESGPIGQVDLGGKTSEGAGSGTVIRDNTLGFVSNGDGGLNSSYLEDHNLCASSCNGTGDQGSSVGDIAGSPVWVGGTSPATFAGFALAPGSPGIGVASDGTNMGVELPTGG